MTVTSWLKWLHSNMMWRLHLYSSLICAQQSWTLMATVSNANMHFKPAFMTAGDSEICLNTEQFYSSKMGTSRSPNRRFVCLGPNDFIQTLIWWERPIHYMTSSGIFTHMVTRMERVCVCGDKGRMPLCFILWDNKKKITPDKLCHKFHWLFLLLRHTFMLKFLIIKIIHLIRIHTEYIHCR